MPVTVDESTIQVTVVDDVVNINVCEQIADISIATTGPQGPMGEVGYADLSYVHEQTISQSVWTIEHNLHFIPNITVVDSAGTVVEGDYNYPDENTVVLTFSGAFAGKAYLS
jgi:hypothetical protein